MVKPKIEENTEYTRLFLLLITRELNKYGNKNVNHYSVKELMQIFSPETKRPFEKLEKLKKRKKTIFKKSEAKSKSYELKKIAEEQKELNVTIRKEFQKIGARLRRMKELGLIEKNKGKPTRVMLPNWMVKNKSFFSYLVEILPESELAIKAEQKITIKDIIHNFTQVKVLINSSKKVDIIQKEAKFPQTFEEVFFFSRGYHHSKLLKTTTIPLFSEIALKCLEK